MLPVSNLDYMFDSCVYEMQCKPRANEQSRARSGPGPPLYSLPFRHSGMVHFCSFSGISHTKSGRWKYAGITWQVGITFRYGI